MILIVRFSSFSLFSLSIFGLYALSLKWTGIVKYISIVSHYSRLKRTSYLFNWSSNFHEIKTLKYFCKKKKKTLINIIYIYILSFTSNKDYSISFLLSNFPFSKTHSTFPLTRYFCDLSQIYYLIIYPIGPDSGT